MIEDEIKEILEKQEEILILTRKIWRAEKWRRFWMMLRYAIFIGIAFGAFYFLPPYIERAISLFRQVKGVTNSVDLQKVLEQLQSPK